MVPWNEISFLLTLFPNNYAPRCTLALSVGRRTRLGGRQRNITLAMTLQSGPRVRLTAWPEAWRYKHHQM